MSIRIRCLRCNTNHKLRSPYPVPGSEIHCPCGQLLAISYPPGLVEQIRADGGTFEDDPPPLPVAQAPKPALARDPGSRAEELFGAQPPPPAPDVPPDDSRELFSEFVYRGMRQKRRAPFRAKAPENKGPEYTELDPDPLEVECFPAEDSEPVKGEPKKSWWKNILGER